jgi:hypothetical protein
LKHSICDARSSRSGLVTRKMPIRSMLDSSLR